MHRIVTKKHLFLFIGFFLALFSSACTEDMSATQGALYSLRIGDKKIRVEAAISETEVRKGLMYRESLPPHQGMLFIFPKPMRLKFWMRNTSIPLDIAYIDEDGVIREIYPLQPHDLTGVQAKRHDLQFALEMNREWFKQNGIGVGDRIALQDVLAIVESRGIAPSHLGLRRE